MARRISPDAFEYYATPNAFTRWLFQMWDIRGTLAEPCVGDGAIVRASGRPRAHWVTNDLDTRWSADYHLDARTWALDCDWAITNPPFSAFMEILAHAYEHSRVGVALHLRGSANEPLRRGTRRSWLMEHPPTALLWLPRFAFSRNSRGKWATDSVCSCWMVWDKRERQQVIDYAPESVFADLERETKLYRKRMDFIRRAA